jgi:DNA-binding response OmpR family regulator
VIVGPVATLEKALKLAEEEEFDAAILDVTIRGGKVFPVAELLLRRGIPFVFASGYGDWALPEELRDKPRLTKPFTIGELEAQVRRLYGEASRERPEQKVSDRRAGPRSSAQDRSRGRSVA